MKTQHVLLLFFLVFIALLASTAFYNKRKPKPTESVEDVPRDFPRDNVKKMRSMSIQEMRSARVVDDVLPHSTVEVSSTLEGGVASMTMQQVATEPAFGIQQDIAAAAEEAEIATTMPEAEMASTNYVLEMRPSMEASAAPPSLSVPTTLSSQADIAHQQQIYEPVGARKRTQVPQQPQTVKTETSAQTTKVLVEKDSFAKRVWRRAKSSHLTAVSSGVKSSLRNIHKLRNGNVTQFLQSVGTSTAMSVVQSNVLALHPAILYSGFAYSIYESCLFGPNADLKGCALMFGGIGSVGVIATVYRPTTIKGAAWLGVIRYLADWMVTLSTDIVFDPEALTQIHWPSNPFASKTNKAAHQNFGSSASGRQDEL